NPLGAIWSNVCVFRGEERRYVPVAEILGVRRAQGARTASRGALDPSRGLGQAAPGAAVRRLADAALPGGSAQGCAIRSVAGTRQRRPYALPPLPPRSSSAASS